jgi:ribose 5-phosphate isomerase B
MRKKFLALAADHRGFRLKEELVRFLKRKRIPVRDFGTFSEESCDYPDYVLKAAETIRRKQADRAIAICHSGIGSAIVANKVRGVRAALVHNVLQAELSRAHNDSNMLILGSGFVGQAQAKKIVEIWLKTPFEGGRHVRRVRKITGYEKRKSV